MKSCSSPFQISETQSDLERANRNATTKELDLQKELEMQRRHVEEELAALSLQHSKRLEELIEQHSGELKKLDALKDEEIKVFFRFYRTQLLHVCLEVFVKLARIAK